MRTARILASLCAVAVLASCTFERINGAIEADVTGVPESAVRAEAVITSNTGSILKREPHFGTGVYTNQVLKLTFPLIAEGPFTVQIVAYDIDDNEVAIGNGAGNFHYAANPDDPPPVVGVPLTPLGVQGTYGAPCILTGTTSNACSGGLACKQYTSTDQGVCTHSCTSTSACETQPSGVTCEGFLGMAANTFCQWECSDNDAGSCPTGLVCGNAIAASGGKRFCQGTTP